MANERSLPRSAEQAFLDAIWAAPDDDVPRLMYADWLMERGDHLGEFIRVQCELVRPGAGCDRGALLQRQHELLDQHGAAWRARLPRRPGVHWGDDEVWHVRGFPYAVEFDDEDAFGRHAPDVLGVMPSPYVAFRRVWECGRLALSPWLARVVTLEVGRQGDRVGDDGTARLAESAYLARLRSLYLYGNAIGSDGAVAIAASPHFTHLEVLVLCDNEIGDAGATALAGSAHLTRLRDSTGRQPDRPAGEARMPELPGQARPLVPYCLRVTRVRSGRPRRRCAGWRLVAQAIWSPSARRRPRCGRDPAAWVSIAP
jgi:uncharacterized protein (TIGR02996 family)